MGRYTAFGLNPNIIARILVLGTPLAGFLAVRPTGPLLPRRGLRAFNLSYVVLSGVAISLTGARQGLIGFGIAAVFLLFLIYRDWIRDPSSSITAGRRGLAAGAGLFLITGTVAVYLITVATNLLSRLLATPAEVASGDFGGRARSGRPEWTSSDSDRCSATAAERSCRRSSPSSRKGRFPLQRTTRSFNSVSSSVSVASLSIRSFSSSLPLLFTDNTPLPRALGVSVRDSACFHSDRRDRR